MLLKMIRIQCKGVGGPAFFFFENHQCKILVVGVHAISTILLKMMSILFQSGWGGGGDLNNLFGKLSVYRFKSG